ncbi:TonB-dependent receptor [Dyadobacter fanqingshengii]|uniref:TonB-dependent receptor n=1 Tax=Dyadobacter fanqingshengii TaxID=2906443 RepID=A0A9X1PF67_9BACT|nr:TonB-dependent receptor [Dyadobacter fanqingshengii]MCF0042132.1 TonB-dependent receptor [Dyadobacter fanqingshengii]USJ35334.1 TonB-dependent receptor [Dyadobacter fanqingshengii]
MQIRYLFLFFLWISHTSQSQDIAWEIAGIVYDEAGKALPSAAVYINNTSIGASTDRSGKFHITVPARYKKVELIASFVGYKPEVKHLLAAPGRTANVVFKLDINNVIREVVITGKRDKHWKRKWRIFQTGLLGDSPLARQCRIVNPESITLNLDEQTGRVTAISNQPVLIENLALGYRVSFQMSKFESDGKKTFLSGYKFFENALLEDPDKKKKQIRNRDTAFKDSFRNFLVSLTRKNLDSYGFEMFTMKMTREFYLTKIPLEREVASGNFVPVSADSICVFDKDKGHFILHSKYPLIVFQRKHYSSTSVFSDYPFKYSQIVLPNQYCTFTENGWLIAPNGITIHDAWASEGFAELLPIDYLPPESDTVIPSIALIQHSGKVKWDAPAETKLPNVEIQQTILDKEGLLQADFKLDTALVTPDYVVSINETDRSGSIFDLLKRIPGLRVTYNERSNEYRVHFVENNANISADSNFDNTVALLLDNVFYSGASTVVPMLNSINVSDLKSISAVRYGSSAGFGSRGGNGTLIVQTKK